MTTSNSTICNGRICSGPFNRRIYVLGAMLLILVGCGKKPDPAPPGASPNKVSPASESPTASNKPPVGNESTDQRKPTPTAKKISIDDSAFQDAALEGRIETVRRAIEEGVDVGAMDEGGRTALLLASFNGHTPIVKLLLDHGAELGHRDATGRTALMYAATGANEETVRLLLEAGAKPNVTDLGEHFTALMHAAAEGQAKVVQLLLQHNADPTLRDVDGDTAGDFATRNGHAEVVRLLTK